MTGAAAKAVLAESGPDAGLPWHYGDPVREQRALEAGRGAVDLSNRGVLTVTGPDRLGWLHSLTTQQLEGLAPGVGVTTLVLSPKGHIEHALYGVDDGETFWAHTEPGAAAAAAEFLDRMRFMMRVEVTDRTDDYAIVWRAGTMAQDADAPGTGAAGTGAAGTGAAGTGTYPARSGPDSVGGYELFVPRAELADALGEERAGTWAREVLRIAAGVPRMGVDTDHRTIPNELGVLGSAVHLDKGCYRGQETVARIHTLGRPPRRLTLLHLDGSVNALPEVGAAVLNGDRTVGFVGSSGRHHELGPIALALVKRNVDLAVELVVDSIAASQEAIVDPEVGLHVRARL